MIEISGIFKPEPLPVDPDPDPVLQQVPGQDALESSEGGLQEPQVLVERQLDGSVHDSAEHLHVLHLESEGDVPQVPVERQDEYSEQLALATVVGHLHIPGQEAVGSSEGALHSPQVLMSETHLLSLSVQADGVLGDSSVEESGRASPLLHLHSTQDASSSSQVFEAQLAGSD